MDQKGIVTVNEIGEQLNVSTMTVRRDLDELAEDKTIIRIHGGAQSRNYVKMTELSRVEKRALHVDAKNEIAKIVASMIEPGDTVYLGPGTTNELVAQHLEVADVRLITNSLPVFESFEDKTNRYTLQLIGGSYRARSGTFIGSLANEMLERLRFTKAFISVNGISGKSVSNASPEEGQTQRIALNNADQRYVVGDHSKLNKRDFYSFYDLDQIDGLITDSGASPTAIAECNQITKVITAPVIPDNKEEK
ncbi:bacterial regulatory s, deor family protein [Lacticaseibacillus saniviri JCM 17471 = DSM 24301]|uniref:Lactose phosphotransferase system repressor n=1 Tax=Lacticaseibacillus saniviri JCM 17471 = DSM 24301 TaxID=1293598 RepID=A0A0R2MPM5_9LACO|nr:bacterial regulatory s, deor family protein [Lacticaseibacillus saniviri JCM 17471 = DSM 24301]